MDLSRFVEKWENLIRPEPDEDGYLPLEYPAQRLVKTHGLSFKYLEDSLNWEGSSLHKYTRHCPKNEEAIHVLTQNQDVPERLFESALRLFADSIVTYYGFDNRKGELRYYPPVVLTFWSGFETFVRRVSELMIATVRDLPAPVIDYLQERETIVRSDGKITRRTCHRPVLDRYAVLLTYGYCWTPDRGSKFWQGLVAANTLRNYYTHLDVTDPRAITSAEALQFMESILLGIIWPSSKLQRTLMLGVYRVYELWELLHQSAEQFTEQPSFLDWHLRKEYLFHCNFENVNIDNFPNAEECIVPRPKES